MLKLESCSRYRKIFIKQKIHHFNVKTSNMPTRTGSTLLIGTRAPAQPEVFFLKPFARDKPASACLEMREQSLKKDKSRASIENRITAWNQTEKPNRYKNYQIWEVFQKQMLHSDWRKPAKMCPAISIWFNEWMDECEIRFLVPSKSSLNNFNPVQRMNGWMWKSILVPSKSSLNNI